MTATNEVLYAIEYADADTLRLRDGQDDEVAVLRDSTRATTAEFIAWAVEGLIKQEMFNAGYGPEEEAQTREELIALLNR